VSGRRLARADGRVAAIMGAGVQARTQLSALEAVLPTLEQVRVWDIDHERADAFRERSDRVVPVANAEDACRRTDVIVAATMAPEPYVPAEWLGPCSLFGSVSSLDAEISCVERADLVVCDLWDHETGHASRPWRGRSRPVSSHATM
jgi:N-[(2S)-2-amino-2-carboxyethyl]-L-glutamate dehydrogenase